MTDKEKITKLLELVNSIQDQLLGVGGGIETDWDLSTEEKCQKIGHESADALAACIIWQNIEATKKEIGA